MGFLQIRGGDIYPRQAALGIVLDMLNLRNLRSWRRLGLFGLILLAIGLLTTVAMVVVEDDAYTDADSPFPEPVFVDPEKRPRFLFPDEVRTYDLSLNQFVDRFFRICSEGKYSEFRLMLATTVLPKRFESMFNALKTAQVLSIIKLPELPEIPGPIYVLTARYDLEDYATRQPAAGNVIRLGIKKEHGQWRIGPIPRAAIARLEAFERSTTKSTVLPVDSAEDERSSIPSQPPETGAPKASANRPARIDS